MKKLIYITIISSTLLIIGCTNDAVEVRTLEIEVYPELAGEVNVTPEPRGYTESNGDEIPYFRIGTEVELEPVSNGEWEFVRWEGDWSSEFDVEKLIIDKNYRIRVVFDRQ